MVGGLNISGQNFGPLGTGPQAQGTSAYGQGAQANDAMFLTQAGSGGYDAVQISSQGLMPQTPNGTAGSLGSLPRGLNRTCATHEQDDYQNEPDDTNTKTGPAYPERQSDQYPDEKQPDQYPSGTQQPDGKQQPGRPEGQYGPNARKLFNTAFQHADKFLCEADRNGDQYITPDEVSDDDLLSYVDVNEDTALSRNELAAFYLYKDAPAHLVQAAVKAFKEDPEAMKALSPEERAEFEDADKLTQCLDGSEMGNGITPAENELALKLLTRAPRPTFETLRSLNRLLGKVSGEHPAPRDEHPTRNDEYSA